MSDNKLSRRDFVKRSVVGAAGVAVGATILAKGLARGANETIGVAVMGIHGRGKGHINAYLGIKGVRVVALVDPDRSLFDSRSKMVEDKQGDRPKCYEDIRDALADKNVDVVSIAAPDHWHALGTIWACQAGKDVYVEKPCSWCIREGRKMVEAAEKYKRIVQVGSQCRSERGTRECIARLWAGEIGKLYMARGLCYKPRGSIGVKGTAEPPPHLNWNLWLGPAQERPYMPNFVHYNWHWFWDFGTADLGNQGVHQMDIARWALNKGLPVKVHSVGGRFGYKDEGETPNTQECTFEYEDGTILVFEVRGLPTNREMDVKIGNLFYGSEGYGSIPFHGSMKTGIGYDGKGKPPEGLKLPDVGGAGVANHFQNFIDCVRSRRREDLNADILEGHLSAALCHLGNISYRLGRKLTFDPKTETFPGDDEANKLLTRDYREPFVVPDKV